MLRWVDLLPTMAGAAAHHGRSRAFDADTPLDDVRREAEAFATSDYTAFLTRGASMPAAERERVLSRLADLIGLPVELVTRAEGRIPINVFARELLRDERKVLGLYDATITVDRPVPGPGAVRRPRPDARGHRARVHDGDQPAAALRDRRRDGP